MAVPLYQSKADLLRVLGHPARVRILELLAEREYAAGELLSEIALEAGRLSPQLAAVRRAGVAKQLPEAGGLADAGPGAEIPPDPAPAGGPVVAVPRAGQAP